MEFTRKATDPDRIVEQVEENALLIASAPDYVNLPDELIHQYHIPVKRANVIDIQYLDWQGVLTLHYKTDVKINERHLWVAKADQFYWHLRG